MSFASGSSTIAGDGQGQTIAIVDAFSDPNIAGDLATFDSHFSIPSANLKVVNQTGGSKLPAENSAWSSETSLDVEWAHAMAPGADLLLVEANSDQLKDLLAGVNYARNAAGVSVVSLSWGGGEWGGETSYDSYFTTPAGHSGVTFVNACGDNGPGNVEWPASSPNVLSVGGTTLNVSDSAGDYGSETGWKYTSGGTSPFEKMPAYQQGLPASDTSYTSISYNWQNGQISESTTSDRSIPDVAFDANPNTGFAVYDSVPYQGVSGWQVAGGTSAGAPQWAALIAIADQGRALAGSPPLDGATATLPLLYGIYANPGTSQYASYASTMHDVTSGGPNFSPATPGYDHVTGLGTPRAIAVVLALGGNPAMPVPGTGAALVVARLGHDLEHSSFGSGPPSVYGSGTVGSVPIGPGPGSGSVGSGTVGSGTTTYTSGGSYGTGVYTPTAPTPTATGAQGGSVSPGVDHLSNTGGGSVFFPSGHGTSGAPGDVPATTPSVAARDASRALGDSRAGAAANAAAPVAVATAPVSATPAGRVAVLGQPSVPAYLSVAVDAASSATPGAASATVSGVSLLASVSGLSIWSHLPTLFASGRTIDAPPALESLQVQLPYSLLGLAPATGTRLDSHGRAWEITAGVCLGVALAGYWYSSATPVEERTQSLKAARLRRVRDGWQLTPVHRR